MFRYKATLASKSLTEEHGKISRLSSEDSDHSKEGMNPGKDSWVFSKDSPSSRKHRDLNRRRDSQLRAPSEEDEVYSVKSSEAPPIEENMKVNVLYRGMVYRIRGIKIVCSILAGIVLLLAAIVILGMWIVLGASEDGKFYFPWSKDSTDTNVTKSVDPVSLDFNSNLVNLTKKGGFLLPVDQNLLLPDEILYEEDIAYRLPSEEVGEALGHLQAVHPRPSYATTAPGDGTTSDDSTQSTYDDSEYYDDYNDYYAKDGDVEYSLRHETFVDPPPNFVNRHNSYEEKVISNEDKEDNFRVHIDGNKDDIDGTSYTHLVRPSELENSDDRNIKEFRPSPRIPNVAEPQFPSAPRFIDSREMEILDVVMEDDRQNIFKDSFTNGHSIHDTDIQMDYIDNDDDYFDINDDVTEPSGANVVSMSSDYNDHVVEYGDILIAKTPENDPTYFDIKSEEYHTDDMPYEKPSEYFQENFDERNQDSNAYPRETVSIASQRRQLQPITENMYVDEEELENDPHRNLFVGGHYDPSQIILEEKSFKNSNNRNAMPLPYFEGGIPPRHSDIARSNRRIPMRPRFPIPPRSGNRHRQFMRKPQIEQQFMRKSALEHQFMPSVPLIRRRPVPGTVHPNPTIRRSHITAGIRPRINKAHVDFIRMQDAKNSQVASRAEKYADSFIAESITYPTIVRLDGTPVFSPFNRIKSNPRFHPQPFSNKERFVSFKDQQSEPPGGFLGGLQKMYEYSTKIAGSLLSFPETSDLAIANSTTDFLKNSFGLLTYYEDMFHSLPEVFMEPLQRLRMPSGDQVDKLNPFELSLMTWTFIDFWEFLIEKVGSLSKEDLQVLEMRLEKIRQQKDNSMARAFIDSIPKSDNETYDDQLQTAVKTFELSLDKTNNTELNKDHSVNGTAIVEESNTFNDTATFGNGLSPQNILQMARDSINPSWDPLGIFTNEERTEFMKYTIHTLFNFGKVYLKSDYALDCMMLLFCKDINSNTKQGGMDGIAARLKSVGLKVLTDKEGRETDTIQGVWQALTKWEPLHCDSMFPKCDGPKALEIVNEVANASRK